MQPIFITGTGTGIGKTVAAAIVTEALQADYWKPVQAGYSEGTDSEWVGSMISSGYSRIHPETYRLAMPASPHIAAREEGRTINMEKIKADFENMPSGRQMVIEGAGGLMVPLNDRDMVIDLIKTLHAKVILVSRHYLGSINHSLLTAQVCRQNNIPVCGWIFNDHYLDYADEIARWSGYPVIGSIPFSSAVDIAFIRDQAAAMSSSLKELLC